MRVSLRVTVDEDGFCTVTGAGCGCCASPPAVIGDRRVFLGHDEDGIPEYFSDDPAAVAEALRKLGAALLWAAREIGRRTEGQAQ